MSMTNNNFERLKIVLDMVDPFNYDIFCMRCELEGVQPLSMNEYAMKVGFVMMAQGKYPDTPIEEAYLKIIDDTNNQQPVGCTNCGDKKDKPLPSLATQAGSLISAVGQHAMSGFKSTDEGTLANRNSICDKCDEMRSDGRCSKCGCYMQIKAKWDSARCPADKW